MRRAYRKWRIIPFDRTLNGIHTSGQTRRFVLLDRAHLTATNVATHPHRPHNTAMSHVAIRAQYWVASVSTSRYSQSILASGRLSIHPRPNCCVGLRLAADKANKRQFVRPLIHLEHLKP